jgi:hypothetical protein
MTIQSGLIPELLEAFEHLQALGELLDLGFGTGGFEVLAQLLDVAIDVDRAQQLADALGTHHRPEIVAVFFGLREEVVLGHDLRSLQRGHARLEHHIGFEVQHTLDVAQGHVQDHAQTRRQRLQEPDVRGRRGQLDVAHALAAHLGQRDLDAALLADHAAMLQALVLAAKTFVVFDRSEDLGAEQTVAFRLERAVVDGLGLLHLAERPRTDLLGRSNARS